VTFSEKAITLILSANSKWKKWGDYVLLSGKGLDDVLCNEVAGILQRKVAGIE